MDKKAFIKSCHRKGYRYVEIAKFLGLSKQRIEQILRPEKNRARVAVLKAKLKKQPCEYPNCGNLKTEAHHFDYSKPLEVNWLCKKHHAEFHSKDKKKIKKINRCIVCKVQVRRKNAKCRKCLNKKWSKIRKERYHTDIEYKKKIYEINQNWRKNNPDKWNAIMRKAVKKYQLTHPQTSKYNKEYYQKNRERFLQNWRNYYQRNRERFLQNWRNYYQRNKERLREKRKEYYYEKKLKQAENKVIAYN